MMMAPTRAAEATEGASLQLIKTLWGIDDPISPTLFESIRDEGYHGVEVIRLAWLFDPDTLVTSLNAANLKVVCQVHTSGGFLRNGDYVYCGAFDVEAHKQDFTKQLQECVTLLGQVDAGGLVNVHAGVDAWTTTQAVEFLTWCLLEVQRLAPSIVVTFETHRQRLFGSPFQARDILAALDASPAAQHLNLRLNADLSHWYCACERVFNPSEARDATWWPALVDLVAARCHYIHARFGWAQGPQMADPSTNECSQDRSLQLKVWGTLMTSMLSRGGGVLASPEYGPAPYLPVHPTTLAPVASLPAAVAYTKEVVMNLFDTLQAATD